MLAKNIIYLETSSIFDWVQIISYLSREEKEVMYQVANDRIKRLFKVENEFYLVRFFTMSKFKRYVSRRKIRLFFLLRLKKLLAILSEIGWI